jgi:hypothetical protein
MTTLGESVLVRIAQVPPAGVFQLEVGLTVRQELINHAAVRPAIWELGAKALLHQLSGVGS